MPAPEPSRNQHGREIWFRYSDDGGYAPAHRKGCLAFALALVWMLLSASVGLMLFVYSHQAWALIVPLVVAVPGLLLMAAIVRRHS